MRDIPECLNRRYQALDELIKELTRLAPPQGASEGATTGDSDAGIKLLCDFWNILKEDPDYDLVQAIQQKLALVEQPKQEGPTFRPENITCYMASKCCKKDDGDDKRRETLSKIKKICSSSSGSENPKCCASKNVSPGGGSEVLPLSKVLCNLKEAASFDKKCNARINELMETQKVLQDQIIHLEHREKEGVQLLKEADCMWTCMEDTYNKKINESVERQKMLMHQLKELETSTAKWRKNKKDLELQLVTVGKCHEEIKDKINQKNSDLKCMDVEIEDFKKRIENNKKDMESVKKSFGTKKQASEAKVAKIAAEISRLEKVVQEEKRFKNSKEQEGSQYVQEARTELQTICKVLLQKKIENEDLRAEREALNFELDVLKKTCDQCKDKCKNRQQEIADEIAKVDKQIKEFKVRCTRCHECTDTVDIRKCCTDCPRCIQERDCLLEKDHCSPDHTMDCVCTTVKQKFLDNVFDNMYTVLERQVKTGPGKAVADAVLNSLKKSRNGKLDLDTRKLLQEFILTTVKKNLNLTIVGGAVKTRCEMDPDTYKQLMLCLQQVKVVKPPKEDKATPAKKDSCRRWGGVSECNCPKGPKACICLKKAPPQAHEPPSCPPPEDKEEESVVIKCPHRDTGACGIDCAMHAVPSRVGADIAAWRPDPCKDQSCRFSKNMRAAQCMLGPESLVSLPKGHKTMIPHVPVFEDLDDLMTCKCGHTPTKPCNCQDRRSQPRERIIEEVMGRYVDMPTIDKVNIEDELGDAESNRRIRLAKNCMSLDVSKDYACQNKTVISDNIPPLLEIHTNGQKHDSIDKFSKDELVTLYSSSGSNEFNKNNELDGELNARMVVILNPQFTGTCSKNTENTDDTEWKLTDSQENQNNIKSNEDFSPNDKSMFGRKVCETVKELLKDIIVPDEGVNKSNNSDVEWVTVDSFMKEITSLTSTVDNACDVVVTSNEIEMKTESLGGPKINKQCNVKLDLNKSDKNKFSRQTELQYTFNNFKDSEVIRKRVTKCKGSSSKLSRNNSKQVKAGIIKPCDKVTCGSLWNEVKEKANRSYSLLEKEIGKETYDEHLVEQFKKVPSVLTDVFSGAHRHFSSEITLPTKPNDNKNVSFGKDVKEETAKGRFKVIIGDEDISGDQMSELKATKTGNFALELDEKVIRLIEEKCAENPSVFVSLDETASENYIINFSPFEDATNKNRRISIKKTPSGARLLEVQKEFVNKLKQSELNRNTVKNNLDFNTKQTNNTCQAMCDCKDHDGYNKYVPNQKSCSAELKRLWDEGTKDITVKVMGRNGLCKGIKGTMIKNSSGDVAIDVTTIRSVGDITLETGECPVLLTPTISDNFLLEICHVDNHFNAVLRRSAVNGIILIAKDSISKPIEPIQRAYETRPKNDFFRVKIKISNKHVEEPPVVLKMTPSCNYTLVLDKEYERTFTNTIDECIGNDSECFVELDKTNSGNFLVIFDENDSSDNCEPNALLTKSPSGHIKMLMHDPAIEAKDSVSRKKMGASSSKAVSHLLDKLPPSNRQIKRDSVKKITLNDAKSCSDSNLYDRLKMNFPDHKGLLEPSATLTRTASGQYAVVLNKESKKAFVNHLRSYLSGSQGLIPIKRKESGEITIALNSDKESNHCGYGSLKITPSGNIYVTIDEKVIEGMAKDGKYSEGSSLGDELSKHLIDSIINPVNKSVTTTCNAKLDTCSCDVSKCVCKDLQLDSHKWFQCNALKDTSILKSQNYSIDSTEIRKDPYGGYKICDPKKCQEPCCAGSKTVESSSNKSPHIVIKPCDCRPVLPKNPRSEECCYVVEAICPYHIDRYDTVPTDLLKISGFSALEKRNESFDKARKTKDNAVSDRSWDSLNYLPPQLPRFLQDVNFR